MQRVIFDSSDPASQLAADEAMLDFCENNRDIELFRLWEPARPFVVLGVGNHADHEADLEACRRRDVPVFRRSSGGGAVLQAPGCLNFSLVLRIRAGEDPLDIQSTHRRVLKTHEELLTRLLAKQVSIQGTSDLVLGALKFSGNAQKRRLRAVLYHGTFLLNVDFNLMEKVLRMPSRQPDYRRERSHREFLTVLPLSKEQLSEGLMRAWRASEVMEFPLGLIETLVAQKYSQPAWNLRR